MESQKTTEKNHNHNHNENDNHNHNDNNNHKHNDNDNHNHNHNENDNDDINDGSREAKDVPVAKVAMSEDHVKRAKRSRHLVG